MNTITIEYDENGNIMSIDHEAEDNRLTVLMLTKALAYLLEKQQVQFDAARQKADEYMASVLREVKK